MYVPKHFEITDSATIDAFVQSNSFGQLISLHDGNIVATHLPFLYLPDERKLIAHLAKANPQWEQIQEQNVLATLQGEHAYVSPNWYESTGVPTWNYLSVHIQGRAETFTDPDRLQQLVDTLTADNEAGYEEPWKPDYPTGMLQGIVGIEIAITSIQCKFKISQNRSAIDRANVRQQLALSGYLSLADAMTEK